VPTWLPFRLQFYCNGHSWLARELDREGIAYTRVDNAFAALAEPGRAQQLADQFPIQELHQALDQFARDYCPVARHLQPSYHWSILQAEYATDVIFRSPAALQPLYETLSRLAVCVVKAPDVATFVGRPLPTGNPEAVGSRFQTQIEGTRIRHHLGPVSLKMYDKHGFILRIETTVNDVSFFRIHREVAHHDGTSSLQLARMQKTLYSLRLLDGVLAACNRRYLAFLATLLDPTAGVEQAERLGQPAREGNRTYRGFNLFNGTDRAVLVAVARPEWGIRGFTNKQLRRELASRSGGQVSRVLKRLRLHGLIERFTRSYRYRLTAKGQQVVLAGLKLRELVVIPTLAGLESGAI
jgi:hypothetical protein